jgi:fumarate reductase flavoprotein subunit
MREKSELILPYALPGAWDEETDVVVVGTGLAGLSAANEAASAGLSVIIIEKMPYIGGNSSIAGGGYCAWDSKLKMREKLSLGDDSWQLHKEDTLRGGAYYGDPVLVETLVREAPFGLDWLIDAGVEFAETLPRIGGHSAHRSYQQRDGSGRKMVEALRTRVVSNGVEIRFETAVTRIFRRDAESPVSGVGVKTASGASNIRAKKAVILAAGGFGRDEDMRTAQKPSLPKDLHCNNHKGATGEVIRYAEAIGASAVQMSFIQLYPCASANTGGMDRFAFDCYSGTGYGLIYVSSDGVRFVNELGGRDEVSDAQLRGLNKPSWSILNARIFERLATPAALIEKGVRSGRLVSADTIEELAGAVPMPGAALTGTVKRHNDYITSGVDPDFGKPVSDTMELLEEGPFYAIAQWPAIHYCMGGLAINEWAAVIDIWGNEIPGLCAAGEVTGGVHGANRLGGNALADCVVFGRRAGRAAAGIKERLYE